MLRFFLYSLILHGALGSDADLRFILEGVNEVWCGSCGAGQMVVYNPGLQQHSAFAIISSKEGDAYTPTAAASSMGRGRIVAFSHTSFITVRPDLLDSDRLLLNSMKWASREVEDVSVAVISGGPGSQLVEFLNEKGFNAVLVNVELLQNMTELSKFGTLLWPVMHDVKDDQVDNIKAFINDGGSLVASCTPWALQDRMNWDFPGNRIIRDSGMIWINRGASATSPDHHFNASVELLTDTDSRIVASKVIELLENPEDFPEVEQSQMRITLRNAFLYVPKRFLPWVEDLKRSIYSLPQIVPTDDSPVNATPFLRFQSSIEVLLPLILDPEEIVAHPASVHFPGKVNSVKHSQLHKITIRRDSKQEEIESQELIPDSDFLNSDPQILQKHYGFWYSTGLYAPAGVPLTIRVESADQVKSFEVRIGCHTDNLSHKPKWIRYPLISLHKKFLGNSAAISSPFGGLVYIMNVETDTPQTFINVTVTGAVATSSFVLGETSLIEWRETIRYLEAPWSEFIGENIVISVPHSDAVTADDPESLIRIWEKIIAANAYLSGSTKFQRFVFDIDISSGYMHSGLPIMGPLSEAKRAVNVTAMWKPNWGFYHELGHNFQLPSWRFENGGEVICNVFAMYVVNTVVGYKMADERPHIFSPENLKRRIEKYIGDGVKYQDFVDDHDLGLIFYYQLERIAGWEVYGKVIQGYQGIPQPPSFDEKRDMWLINFSTAAGRSFSLLFRSWGIPISAEAVEKISHLPDSGFTINSLLEF